MSADNGVYILETDAYPIKKGNMYENQHGVKEYRVAHAQAIENVEYSELYWPAIFGDSKVFSNLEDAREEAIRIEKETPYTEYGISIITFDRQFPNITKAAALVALDCYVGVKPLDVPKKFEWDKNVEITCNKCKHVGPANTFDFCFGYHEYRCPKCHTNSLDTTNLANQKDPDGKLYSYDEHNFPRNLNAK